MAKGHPNARRHLASTSAGHVDNGDIYKPRFITSPVEGKLLLGGDAGLERDVDWYNKLLNYVKSRNKTNRTDQILRQNVMLQSATCKIFEGRVGMYECDRVVTKWCREKINIPKLNDRVLCAIFTQAKTQFPGFTDWYTQSKCDTVYQLNHICKLVRKELSRRDTQDVHQEDNENQDGPNGDQLLPCRSVLPRDNLRLVQEPPPPGTTVTSSINPLLIRDPF